MLTSAALALCGSLCGIFVAEVERAGDEEHWKRYFGQVTVESHWRPEARSRFACGLGQFTEATQGDEYPRTNPSCEGVDCTEPSCSVRALISYMDRLRIAFRKTLEPWPFAQASYNGGAGWIRREQRKCRETEGCDPRLYFDNVQNQCIRAEWACRENTKYAEKIIREMRKL